MSREALFRETNPYLLRLAAAQGFFGDEAHELVHQTWEQYFANQAKFQGHSSLRTFIAGILINKIRERRRDLKRIDFVDDAESLYEGQFTPDGWWKSPPEDPSRLLELKESMRNVRDCLTGLTDDQRAAFVLREVEGETPDEICNVLGVASSHLRVLLFRAKAKLRSCLEGKL